ncbi:DinB family protein [Nonomuraea endophytica]|uniref:Putative damage-inducible protein DinB n=1 Tax=Nonomuraea endophytica TaxID=714136 RepID=A0A7W8EMT7_9ACTN|nr:DinB family protein [Nonomuraea endophytica]MBB5085016.1 putative damage-inducible protein DinB [Nonomuraea endophytica]
MRIEPPVDGDERSTLEGFLDYHRQTLAWKCEGLTDEQLRTRALPPSTMSLLGLIRHMAEVERSWFRRRLGGQTDLPFIYVTDEDPDADFDRVDEDGRAGAFKTWESEIAAAREATAGVPLDGVVHRTREPLTVSVRWVYFHMIEEYARHNGHADLLRERIDGATGE